MVAYAPLYEMLFTLFSGAKQKKKTSVNRASLDRFEYFYYTRYSFESTMNLSFPHNISLLFKGFLSDEHI